MFDERDEFVSDTKFGVNEENKSCLSRDGRKRHEESDGALLSFVVLADGNGGVENGDKRLGLSDSSLFEISVLLEIVFIVDLLVSV